MEVKITHLDKVELAIYSRSHVAVGCDQPGTHRDLRQLCVQRGDATWQPGALHPPNGAVAVDDPLSGFTRVRRPCDRRILRLSRMQYVYGKYAKVSVMLDSKN